MCSAELPVGLNRYSLRKHAYLNILKISPQNAEYFSDKNSDIFHISAQNIDCGYSLEPPCRGSKLYRYVFVMPLMTVS